MVPPAVAALVGDVQAVLVHALSLPFYDGPVVATSDQALDYLRASMAYRRTELLRVLFLGSGNHVIADELLAQGCVSEVAVYPRQILKRALEIGASALVLVHNHPSGDHRPSRADIDATRRVAAACRSLEIQLHDHLVIARSGWSSFRTLGLI